MGIQMNTSSSDIQFVPQQVQFSVVTDSNSDASLFTLDTISNVLAMAEELSSPEHFQTVTTPCNQTEKMDITTRPRPSSLNSDVTCYTDGEATPGSSTSGHTFQMDSNDQSMSMDTKELGFEFDLLPFIKEELKWKIQTQRHAKGKTELMVEKREIKESKLTKEDEAKRTERRERNKIAAVKCRQKKRAKSKHFIKIMEKLDADQQKLKLELLSLRSEKDHLIDLLQDHIPSCTIQNEDGTLVLCNNS